MDNTYESAMPVPQRIYAVIALFIVLNCHITRNINGTVYMMVLLFTYALAYFMNVNEINKSKKSLLAVSVLLAQMYIILITPFWLPASEFWVAAGRFSLILPYVFLIATVEINSHTLNRLLKIYCIVVAVAAISVLLQIVMGQPISWFAPFFWRGGMVRYASFLGSVTALGTIGIMGMAILLFSKNLFNKKTKILILLVMFIGMIATLQTAAIANLLLLLAIYFIFNFVEKKRPIRKILLVILGSGAIVFVSMLTFNLISPHHFEYMQADFLRTFGRETEITLDGQNMFDDLMRRLTHLPNRVIETHHTGNPFWFFTGMGLIALAGNVGLPHYPMAHNGFADMLFSGGFLYFMFMLLLCIIPTYRGFVFIRKGKDTTGIVKGLVAVMLLSGANMLAAGAQFIHPNSATILWLSIFVLLEVDKIFSNDPLRK